MLILNTYIIKFWIKSGSKSEYKDPNGGIMVINANSTEHAKELFKKEFINEFSNREKDINQFAIDIEMLSFKEGVALTEYQYWG